MCNCYNWQYRGRNLIENSELECRCRRHRPRAAARLQVLLDSRLGAEWQTHYVEFRVHSGFAGELLRKRQAAASIMTGLPSADIFGASLAAEQQASHRRRTDDIEPVPDVPDSSSGPHCGRDNNNDGGPEALGLAMGRPAALKLRTPCDRVELGAGALVRDVGGAGDNDAIWAVDCVPAAARPARAVGFVVEYLLGVPPGRAVVVAGSGRGGLLG